MTTDRTPNQTGQQRKIVRPLKKLVRVEIADAVAITALRLTLLQNGYPPIPAHDKRTMFKGWNIVELTPAAINEWLGPRASRTPYPGTGLRIEGGLATIDLDLPDGDIAAEARAAIMAIAPQVFEVRGALERGRSDGSPKCMFFLRREGEPFTVKSKKWSLAPGDDDAPGFRIEMFASERNPEGKVRRQVGAFGPHTVDDDSGKILIEYAWKGRSPADVPLDDLPTLSEAEARAIALEMDRIAVAHGLHVVPGYSSGRVDPIEVYDLVEEMQFEGEDYGPVNLTGLIEVYRQNEAMGADTRCSGSFTGEGGTRKDRCHVGWSGGKDAGHITVHDYATEMTHRPREAEPVTPAGLSQAMAEVAALFREDDDGGADPVPGFGDRWNAAIGETVAGDLSEDSFAVALAGLYGEKLCFDPFERQWLRFEAPCWAAETEARVASIVIGTFCRSIPLPRSPQGVNLRRRIGSHRHASAVERKLRALLEYRDGFDGDPYLAAGQTVAIDLRTGASRPGEPADRLRKRLACDPLDESDCPLWREFLGQVTLGDQELQRFLQQWAGMGLSGDPTHQKVAFFYGGGRNGKNTFIDVIRRVAGDYGYEADIGAFMASRYESHPTGLWALKGKRTVIASEVDEGAAWDTIKVKALTGNDAMTARGMRRDFETFPRTWTITIIGNSQPKLKSVDEAMRRRIRMIPFDLVVDVVDIDLELPKKLFAEAPGILRWAIEGLVDARWYGLIEPVRVQAETAEYFEAEDMMAAYARAEVEIDPRRKWAKDPWSASSAELFRRWTEFAHEQGFPAGDAKTFSKRLSKLLKIKVEHGRQGNFWPGIKLRERKTWDQILGSAAVNSVNSVNRDVNGD